MSRNKKTVLIILLSVIAALLTTVIGYVSYVLCTYYRIEDNLELDVEQKNDISASVNTEYKIISYNIGFAAYTPDFGFFMDGGKESRAKSEESVISVINGISDLINSEDADIVMFEEVDTDSDRSWHIDQKNLLKENINNDYSNVFAYNFDSPFLFYPIFKPHGKSVSGLLTLSKFNIESSIRRSLPVEDTLMKLVDLDRCYTVSRVSVDNGKELVLYTLHLSAYTSDGTIATEQLSMLINDMKAEYERGNYCIAGGDFNKDLTGDNEKYFGISGEEYTWAQPIPDSTFDGTGLKLIVPLNESNPIPSCRNADSPYHEGQFVLTVDGFIVSDNIEVSDSNVIDTAFKYSDHNPVYMKVKLK